MRDVADQELSLKINSFLVRKSLQFPELNLCNKHGAYTHQSEPKPAIRTKVHSNKGIMV